MKPLELWQQVKESFYNAMELVVEKTQKVATKAKESAEVAKARLEVKKLEMEIAKKFAELGSKVYELSVKAGEQNPLENQDIKNLINQITELDRNLAQTQALLEQRIAEDKAKQEAEQQESATQSEE